MRTSRLLGLLSIGTTLVVAAPRGHAGTCTPSRAMVVLDKSSSMVTGTIGGVTKWALAVDALDAVLMEHDDRAEFGLMTFPSPSACGPGQVEVPPALGSRADILTVLDEPPPTAGNWTPMSQTLAMAQTEASLITGDGAKHLILVSDGWQWCSPYDPATRFDAVDEVAALTAMGITTHVVGFGASVDALALNQMAVTAGTARAGCDPANDDPADPDHCYLQADDAAELAAALEFIVGEVTVEVCDGLDNDCDGLVDEDLTRACATDCGTGAETCSAGSWVGCDAPAPSAEVCDGLDNNCDGTTDPGCECDPGETRPCGGAETEGQCAPGTQTCSTDGQWGSCEGEVGPSGELCDGLDNDCDGRIDDGGGDEGLGNLCDAGEVCIDGGCEPVDPAEPPSPEDEDPGFDDAGAPAAGCGCQGGVDGGGAAPLLLALGFLALRRRRRA